MTHTYLLVCVGSCTRMYVYVISINLCLYYRSIIRIIVLPRYGLDHFNEYQEYNTHLNSKDFHQYRLKYIIHIRIEAYINISS